MVTKSNFLMLFKNIQESCHTAESMKNVSERIILGKKLGTFWALNTHDFIEYLRLSYGMHFI